MNDGLGRPTLGRAQEIVYCSCGSAWFDLAAEDVDHGTTAGAVSIDGSGSVIAYSGVLRCRECGEMWEPGDSYLQLVR
jgi:hypothetical protein